MPVPRQSIERIRGRRGLLDEGFGAVPNALKAGAAGLLGMPSDVLQLMASAQAGNARMPAPNLPFTSDDLARRFGANLEEPSGQIGLLGAPDPSDVGRAIGLLAFRSPAFNAMFKNSKLVDESGELQRLYHGSTGDIEKFDLSLANPESDWGAGIYLTNSIDDVNANYAGFGPDLTQRIELKTERIIDEAAFESPRLKADIEKKAGKPWDEMSYDERRDAVRPIVRDELRSTNEGQVSPVFAAVERPVIVGGENPTFFDLEYLEDVDEEVGGLVDFIDAIRERADDYEDFDVDRFVSDLYEKGFDYGGLDAQEIQNIAKTSEGIIYATDDTGRHVSNEIIRKALEDMGYDGIIDRTINEKFGLASDMARYGNNMRGVDENTVHVVVFDPDKLNTAIGSN